MNNNITQERRQTLAFRLAFITAVVATITVFLLIGLEVYVRWIVNRDFVFLGGFELEALTISTFILILGVIYLFRPERP